MAEKLDIYDLQAPQPAKPVSRPRRWRTAILMSAGLLLCLAGIAAWLCAYDERHHGGGIFSGAMRPFRGEVDFDMGLVHKTLPTPPRDDR